MDTRAVLDFQIQVEGRISRIYRRVAQQSSPGRRQETDWGCFWRRLATDERVHALLLCIVRDFLRTGVHVERPVGPGEEVQQQLDRLLSRCEEKVLFGVTRREAIDILQTLERSEVNRLFASLLGATDSKVLSQFSVFSHALQEHERRVLEGIRKYAGGARARVASANVKEA